MLNPTEYLRDQDGRSNSVSATQSNYTKHITKGGASTAQPGTFAKERRFEPTKPDKTRHSLTQSEQKSLLGQNEIRNRGESCIGSVPIRRRSTPAPVASEHR